MKKIIYLIIVLNFIAFKPSFLYSQNQSVGGIVYGSDWAFLVSAPDGWIMDSQSLSHYNIFALFYENGRTLGVGTPIIYINSTELALDTDEEMKVYIAWDLGKHNKNGSMIVELNNILNDVNDTYYIYNIENTSGQFETIIYRRYRNICFSIILNAPNENIRQQLFSKMEEVIKSMLFMDRD